MTGVACTRAKVRSLGLFSNKTTLSLFKTRLTFPPSQHSQQIHKALQLVYSV